MRHIYPKTHTILSSSSSSSNRPNILLLLLQEPQPFSSRFCYSHSRGSHSLPRRHHPHHEEEPRHVRVSVWWDFENCNVPSGMNVFKIGPAITAAVRANGIKGPIEITAFGDMLQLSRLKQEGLSSTGINLTHIPRDGKNSTDRSLLLSLMCWVSQNPPPAHLFLISGDRDFASTLHRLRMNNYNILLATPDSAHGVLCSAASIMWNWHDLLRGDSLTGKYFNQPPDGPYGSWYGHYKMPLLDPFLSDVEEPCLQNEELSEPYSDDKPPCSVPKAVINQIRQMVESNPKGISISEFRNELARNVNLDKEYYGYKRFLPFLLSLNNIVNLRRVRDGNFTVHGVSRYGLDCEDESFNGHSEFSCDVKNMTENGDGKAAIPESVGRLSSSPTSDLNVKDRLRNRQNNSPVDENMIGKANASDARFPSTGGRIVKTIEDEKVVEAVEVKEKIVEKDNVLESDYPFPRGDEKMVESVNEPESSNNLPPMVQQEEPSSDDGVFRRFCRKWFGSKNSRSNDKSREIEEKSEGKDSAKDSKPTVGFVDPSSNSSSFSEPAMENSSSEAITDKPGTNPRLLGQIRNWFRSTLDTDKLSNRSSDGATVIISDSGHKLFSRDSFWSTMESFIYTSQGSLLVSESRTRQQMAFDFQRKGPECLQSLGENDMLNLVDLLISEKKWVEECPSEAFPFKLTWFGKASSLVSHPSTTSNNLSSLFISQSSQSAKEELPNHDGEGKVGNTSCVMSREQVLADCQNLVNEISIKHPSGFFVGLFRKDFLEKYGYQLDFQKLGYPELAALLSTMSGVKIKSGHIIPCNYSRDNASLENTFPFEQESVSHRAALDSSLSDASKNGYGLESLWEELGPVSSARPSRSSKRLVEPEENSTDFDYEPAASEDEFSDSDEVSRAAEKPVVENQDSSLLRILDSWHCRNELDLHKNKSENAVAESDLASHTAKLGFATDSAKLSSNGVTTEPPSKMQRKNQRPVKGYSFVLDSGIDSKNDNKLASGVLRHWRNPNEPPKIEKDKVLCQ